MPVGDRRREALDEFKGLILGYLEEADRRRVAFLKTGKAEELHKYRVGVRHARAALAVGKGWVSDVGLSGCRNGLARAMKCCNRLRDLDVKCVDFALMTNALPKSMAPAVAKCLKVIEGERGCEFDKATRILSGNEMVRFVKGLRLSRSSAGHVVVARGLGGLVRKRVAKLVERIVRLSRELTPDSEEESWHRIRIESKKARYLVEIFGGYFPKGKKMLAPLVRIQKALGNLNDNAMQVAFLSDPIWRKPVAEDVELAMCLGGLAVLLEQRGVGLRREAGRELGRFRKACAGLLKGVR